MDKSKKPLEKLRRKLQKDHLDGFLIPRGDEHQNEYVAPYAERLAWVTGFTGSAGFSIILHHKAALFSDGRYLLQMADEVNPQDFSCYHKDQTSPLSWAQSHMEPSNRIGYDPWIHRPQEIEKWIEELPQVTFVPCTPNPIDLCWKEKPPRPCFPLRSHPLGGLSSEEKRKKILSFLQKEDADGILLSAPDSISWLLNIRGNDIPHTPIPLVFFALFNNEQGVLLTNNHSLPSEIREWLGDKISCINLGEEPFPFSLFKNKKIILDQRTAVMALKKNLEDQGASCLLRPDPCFLPKAIKNEIEIQGARQAHERDGHALIQFMAWFYTHPHPVTEIECAEKLLEYRRQETLFLEPSFPTIAGSGPHGAIIHYRVTPKTNRIIGENDLFLLDSGGQYEEGTTDVTRVLIKGTPTDEQKEMYTRVLKGHIALAMSQFPEGTTGQSLDILARQFLWQVGMDYDHGTGHGVGSCLSVHEGPQGISQRGTSVPLQPGMILSNEPGFYKPGHYGIRIENLMVVEKRKTPETSKSWLGFETLTLVPLEKKLIKRDLLTPQEEAWIKAYHDRIQSIFLSQFSSLPSVFSWLQEATSF